MAAGRVTSIAPIVWERLESSPPHGDGVAARLAVPEITDFVLAAIDADRRRHVLIRLNSLEEGVDDSDSRGLAVSTRELHVAGHEGLRHIDVICEDSAGHDAFDLIGAEIASRISGGQQSPAESVRSVLAKWRRFWGRVPKDVLQKSEQVGLYAELWFLRYWLIERLGPEESLARWRGPFGARHDFEWHGGSVEVKGTTSIRRVVHRINGIDQLSPPETGKLLFFSLQLREEQGASGTLPGLVEECRSVAAGNEGALVRLESALGACGYFDVHRPAYEVLRLRTVREGLYRVEGTFPRLTSEQLKQKLSSSIEHVEYEINLAGQEGLLVASSGSEVWSPD